VLSVPSTLTGAVAATFGEPVHAVGAANVALRVSGTATNLPGSLACRDSSNNVVSCALGPVTTARFTPAAALYPGQHYTAFVDPAGAGPAIDPSGNATVPAAASFRGSLVEQETSVRARYQWRTVTTSSAWGGSYTTEHSTGAAASFSFTGTSVKWYTVLGPNQGLASVSIDGTSKGTFDNHRSAYYYGAYRSFAGLSAGSHVMVITVKGAKGSPNGTGTFVSVDAMKVGTSAVLKTPPVTYKWRTALWSGASGGRYAYSDQAGAFVSFTFRGTGIDWYAVFGSYSGKAAVYIDGSLKTTVDLYRSTNVDAKVTFSHLTDALHTVKILVLGTKQTASKGSIVSVDKWSVL
jgi:hypothetical protein